MLSARTILSTSKLIGQARVQRLHSTHRLLSHLKCRAGHLAKLRAAVPMTMNGAIQHA